MASVQWIRINTDMFDNAKIKYIRTLPSGNDLVVIWVMLLTKAGKCNSNGFIFLTENIPYTADMLAAEFGFEINTINLALNTFANLNMIQLEDSKILITGWEEHQNIEGLEKIREQTRKRVARHREKLALEQSNVTCNVTVTQSNATDKNKKRIDKDKDIDINNKKEKEKKVSGLDEIINNYTSNLDLQETLQDFLKMRKSQKKPMTDRALKTLLKKLDTLATNDTEKIDRLEESICNCWLTVYPKKDFNNKNYKQESLDTKANKNYENLKKIMKEQQEHYEENVAKYMADCEEVPF